MSIHVSMLNVLVSLGYTRTPGCCHGFSLRWLEACLLGEENVFNGRIHTIDTAGYSLVHWINAAKNKKGHNLTENDSKLLDILSFLDSLELYQSPHTHVSTFNAPLTQDDVDIISNVASSVAILSRGGLARVYSEPGIYTKDEIKAYLDGLGVVIENACAQSKEPLGIVLSSHNHTIALTYTPGKGWNFMDINQFPSKSFTINETNGLAEHLMMGFVQSNSPYSAFNVSVFTTGNHLELLNLKKAFDSFKKSHPLTREIASREAEGISLVQIAVQNGHADILAELVKQGVDLNKVDINGGTLAYIAAEKGHASVIAELAKHHKEAINKALSNGATPAFIAAQNGHASVIAELAKHKVNLNQTISNGITLAFVAAQKGHALVIAELAKQKIDLNKAIGNGLTPAFIAAQQGHANVIAALATSGVDLNLASNGVTPAFIAAQQGHANVIAELAIYGVDLNLPISNGVTPAFIASQQGHASVIAELIKVGVNFNTPFTASVDSLRQLTISRDATVIERMNHFIAQQRALSSKHQMISITPYQIAVVMGHTDIVQLLQIKEFSNESYQLMNRFKDGVNKSNWEGNRFFNSVSKEVPSIGVASSSQQIISL